jgi:hypothetical protein
MTNTQPRYNDTHTIVIKPIDGHYYAISDRFTAAMGSDTIPTPFTTATPLHNVIATIQDLNANAHVVAAV